MSLELFAFISPKLDKTERKQLINEISRSEYRNVYFREEDACYGFVHSEDSYTDGSFPLFDLIITDSVVNLSLYGDLNELHKVKEVVTFAFEKMGISVHLNEECE